MWGDSMTDNEIIKALELCVYGDYAKCHYDCPYKRHCSLLTKDALDLINSQNAEIDRLRDVVEKTDNAYYQKVDEVRTAKAEAIKEFVVKLLFEFRAGVFGYSYIRHIIKSIAKEMVGDNNG